MDNNYSAQIVQVNELLPLEGSDNLLAFPVIGMQAIVSKDVKLGDVGVVFVAETQLSDEYVSKNNLYRDGNKNENKEKTGFIENNRRIRAIKLRGNRSDALYMPLSSLSFTKANLSSLKVGDMFYELNGVEICRKYQPVRKCGTLKQASDKDEVVPSHLFPEHFSTSQYYRQMDKYHAFTDIIVTQKLHGTSVRVANIPVRRKLSLVERVARRLGAKIQETDYHNVYGSRHVIKGRDENNNFYDEDIWSKVGRTLDGVIPQNYIVFGEIIGWINEKSPIQKGYTYRIPAGQSRLYVYRVATVNPEGRVTDLSWDQVKEWCQSVGVEHVPELWRGKHGDFSPTDWVDKNFHDELHGGYQGAVPLGDESPCDEGICIRVDGVEPFITKIKSPQFYAYETQMLDEGVEDVEESQNA